jgi:hypothetical protein
VTSQPSRPQRSARSGDVGDADPKVATALAAYASGGGGSADVVAALAVSRLLVPVVAVLDETGDGAHGDLPTDKASHMATVTTAGRDGRRGLLAFTCVDAMRRWRADARPVPVPTRDAAEAALAEGAEAVVVDLAGPVVFAIEAADLRALAGGWRALGGDQDGSIWAATVGMASDSDEEQDASVHRIGGRGWRAEVGRLIRRVRR